MIIQIGKIILLTCFTTYTCIQKKRKENRKEKNTHVNFKLTNVLGYSHIFKKQSVIYDLEYFHQSPRGSENNTAYIN